MEKLKKILFIFMFASLFIGCSQKSKTPTDFKMTLAGLSTTDTGFNGGITLKGNNGSDRFSIGLTPSEIDSFSIELPDGDWKFMAIGWLNDGGQGLMTGQARCGYAQSSIDGSDTSVSMSLSQSNCIDNKISADTSADTTQTNGFWFKKLKLISCLNPQSITAGDLCNGPELHRLPGESASVRIVSPGLSTFSSSMSGLRSKCFSNQGALSGDMSSGETPTSLRLPFSGSTKFPWAIETFSDVNCKDYDTTYPMPDGLTGTSGVYRLADTSLTDTIPVNFADNFFGKAGSVFDDINAQDFLPSFNCQDDCYDSTSFSPSGFGGAKDRIRDHIWRELGNVQNVDPQAIVSSGDASITMNDPGSPAGLTVFAPNGSGSAGNNIEVFIEDVGGVDPVTATCEKFKVTVQYDSSLNSHQDTDMADAVNNCGDGYSAQAETAGTIATFDMAQSALMTGGSSEIQPTRRASGQTQSITRLLYGPIGVALNMAGLVDESSLCSGSYDGSYEFNLPGQNVKISLLTPSSSATLPDFNTYTLTQFERKILVELDGNPEEAFYFNCSTDRKVGTYLSLRDENSTRRLKQVIWDTTTAGSEWLETGAKEVDQDTNEIIWQSSFILNFSSNDPYWDAWSLDYHQSGGGTDRTVGNYDFVGDLLHTQSTFTYDGDANYTSNSFVLQAEDQVWNISTDTRSPPVTPVTLENPPAPLDLNPNLFLNYTASDFESGTGDNFWNLSY